MREALSSAMMRGLFSCLMAINRAVLRYIIVCSGQIEYGR